MSSLTSRGLPSLCVAFTACVYSSTLTACSGEVGAGSGPAASGFTDPSATPSLASPEYTGPLGPAPDTSAPVAGPTPLVDTNGDGIGDTPSALPPDPANPSAAVPGEGPAQSGVETQPEAEAEPGRVPLKRLNRSEYYNTVRDLLGVSARPTLPEDQSLRGFDNIAEALVLTPQHLVAYEAAALELVDEALGGATRSSVIGCDVSSAECRAEALQAFMRRAWRRAVTTEEVSAWTAKFDELVGLGANDEEAFRHVLSGVLLSPHFLFHVELDPEPTSTIIHPLSEFELANRLSYFLWSSAPDDTLLDLAEQGLLSGSLLEQATRMLADDKASALVDNFGQQWLNQRRLEGYSPSPLEYPSFDERLGSSVREETRRFFEHVLVNDLPVTELLDAQYSFIDERLGELYGVTGASAEMAQTPLPSERLGVLTHASVLMANAEPNRSSIVKRGVWVMSNLLCLAPPPPPGNVDTSTFDATGDIPNQRDRLAAHAEKPECATCHAVFDPAGVAFEHYDGIGRYRATDGGQEVNAAGTVADITFEDGVDFAKKLAADPRYPACVAQKLLMYGTGRLYRYEDAAYVAQAMTSAGATPSIEGLVLGLVQTDAFQRRRGEPDSTN